MVEQVVSELERELSASIELAEAKVSARPAVRAVAPPSRQCGEMHRGRLEPCPADAFECDLPAVEVGE